MHVCMVLGRDFLYPGRDPRVYREAKALIEGGHELTLVCRSKVSENVPKEENYEGINVLRILQSQTQWKPSILSRAISSMKRFAQYREAMNEMVKLVKDLMPDAVHCHDLEVMPVGVRAKRALNIPLIFDMHENYPAMMRAIHPKKRLSMLSIETFFAKYYERRCCNLADRVIVVTEESRERLERIGIEGKKIWVISNTVDLKEISQGQENGSEFTIVYTGGFGPHRGLELPIKAMPKVIEKIPEAKLILVGDGSNMDDLKKLTSELGLEKNVEFPGWVDGESLKRYVRKAHVCIIPHKVSEHTNTTIPNKIFEYMAFKKPVIVTNARPMERIIRETNAGFVVKDDDYNAVADHIIKLHEPSLRKALGENGRKAIIEKYNWSLTSKELCRMYRQLENPT